MFIERNIFLVRQKTKDLMEFIQDDERLREERKKAKKNKDKYTGIAGRGSMGRYDSSYSGLRLRIVNKRIFFLVYPCSNNLFASQATRDTEDVTTMTTTATRPTTGDQRARRSSTTSGTGTTGARAWWTRSSERSRNSRARSNQEATTCLTWSE